MRKRSKKPVYSAKPGQLGADKSGEYDKPKKIIEVSRTIDWGNPAGPWTEKTILEKVPGGWNVSMELEGGLYLYPPAEGEGIINFVGRGTGKNFKK
jgi:hypothetical protein